MITIQMMTWACWGFIGVGLGIFAGRNLMENLEHRHILKETKRIVDDAPPMDPAELVELARDVDHPLHDKFNWDDEDEN